MEYRHHYCNYDIELVGNNTGYFSFWKLDTTQPVSCCDREEILKMQRCGVNVFEIDIKHEGPHLIFTIDERGFIAKPYLAKNMVIAGIEIPYLFLLVTDYKINSSMGCDIFAACTMHYEGRNIRIDELNQKLYLWNIRDAFGITEKFDNWTHKPEVYFKKVWINE